MAHKKTIETLPEKEVEKLYEIVKGFNLSDGRRFEVGNADFNFITEKDISAEDFNALLEMNAIVLAVEPEETEEN